MTFPIMNELSHAANLFSLYFMSRLTHLELPYEFGRIRLGNEHVDASGGDDSRYCFSLRILINYMHSPKVVINSRKVYW